MLVRFRDWASEAEKGAFRERIRAGEDFFRALLEGKRAEARARLGAVSSLLSFECLGEEVVLTYDEVSARPFAQLLSELAPQSVLVRVGGLQKSHEQALESVRRAYAVDLSTSRVRVGFTRGHLMDVVVSIPLDVDGDKEVLNSAAELYLQLRLGDELFDTWVLEVGVDRINRTRGLVMVSDARASAPTSPLELSFSLVEKGAHALTADLPVSLLLESSHAEDWVALEIPEAAQVIQAERRFAATRFPEALKACLEGLPHDSTRYTRGGELFVYVVYQVDGERRATVREQAELFIANGVFRKTVVLAGTGFGRSTDYLDLWMLPDGEHMRGFFQALCQITGPLEVGFYDEQLSGERAHFRPQS